jgi:hypothetical protein
MRRLIRAGIPSGVAAVAGLFLASPRADATIVGLNQIVTPEIQPAGVLALSAQAQHSTIGNSQQIQFELGVTPKFEVAWFQGLKPSEGIVAAELNLVKTGPHLLTTGIVNWSTRGGGAQPLLEYGYYADHDQFVVGGIYVDPHTDLILGYKHQFSEKIAFSADFQSGSDDFVTVGLTYNFTPTLSINPAIYCTNSHPHHFLGYVVLTWNLTIWK